MRRKACWYKREKAKSLVPVNARFRHQVRSNLSWEQVMSICNIPINTKPSGHHRILCIYHIERTPSLICWPDGGFFCFGCCRSGDLVDFVAKVKKLRTSTEIRNYFNQLLSQISNP